MDVAYVGNFDRDALGYNIQMKAVLLVAAITIPVGTAQSRKSWLDYGGGPDGSHFAPFKKINKANAPQRLALCVRICRRLN